MNASTIAHIYHEYTRSEGVSTDTRHLRPNQIFFALKGPNFDGNTYAAKALESGARWAVIDDPQYYIPGKTLLVSDTLSSLQWLAMHHRNHLTYPILGIAGSNGKTTTKELIYKVLATKYKVVATQGNLNNHIGVPLTLLSLPTDLDMAILELGANHVYELMDLCHLARPTHGLVTNVGKDHLEGYGTLQGVMEGNGELYKWLGMQGGVAWVNGQEPYLDSMSIMVKQRYFYGRPSDDIYSTVQDLQPSLSIVTPEGHILRTQLFGSYNQHNIHAAWAVGAHFGVPMELISKSIAEYVPSNNRSQMVQKGSNVLILDCYNANPSSVESALRSLASMATDHKVAILGDMFELGSHADQEHRNILNLARSLGLDQVLTCGKIYASVGNAGVASFDTLDALKDYLRRHPLHHSTILIKGSRGMAMEKLADYLSDTP